MRWRRRHRLRPEFLFHPRKFQHRQTPAGHAGFFSDHCHAVHASGLEAFQGRPGPAKRGNGGPLSVLGSDRGGGLRPYAVARGVRGPSLAPRRPLGAEDRQATPAGRSASASAKSTEERRNGWPA